MIKKSIFICVLLLIISAFAFAETVDTIGDVVLKPGVEDSDIGFIKLSMMLLGYYDTQSLTQTYDETTVAAVKAFQKAQGLDVDGIIGEKSYEALYLLDALPTIQSKVLKPLERNLDVKKLKVALRSLNYLTAPVLDDLFDTATEGALKAFQKAENLDIDGIAGQATFSRLIELKRLLLTPSEENLEVITAAKLEKGMVSEEVIILQKALAIDGVFTSNEYSTNFGDLTLTAVKAFQKKYKMISDGVVGLGTLAKLEELGYIKRGVPVVAVIAPTAPTAPTVAVNTPAVASVAVSRGVRSGKLGEYIAWNDVRSLFTNMSTVLTVEDFETGITFKVQVSYGHLHSDVEALTAEDSRIIKAIWGGDWSWNRRAVLVYYKDRVLAASMNGMPHAGLENKTEGITVGGRSAGFGTGYNYDSIKGNLMDGHLCMHFKDSRLHTANKIDAKHQAMIKKAAGIQ